MMDSFLPPYNKETKNPGELMAIFRRQAEEIYRLTVKREKVRQK